MLTEVKNQLKVNYLSIKYGLMREMVNKFSFLANIIFMIINNSCFIIQWVVLYSLKENIGGYTFKQMFTILGGLIIACVSVIANSLAFWFNMSDVLADTLNNMMITFGTYPKDIFNGIVKILLYTLIPVGIANYIPIDVIISFSLSKFLIVFVVTIFMIVLSFYIFNKGLKRYSSSNLMSSRI